MNTSSIYQQRLIINCLLSESDELFNHVNEILHSHSTEADSSMIAAETRVLTFLLYFGQVAKIYSQLNCKAVFFETLMIILSLPIVDSFNFMQILVSLHLIKSTQMSFQAYEVTTSASTFQIINWQFFHLPR